MSRVQNKWLVLVLAAASMAGSQIVGGCKRQSGSVTDTRKEQPPRSVRAVRTHLEPLERTVRSFGSLSAHEQAILSTKVPGRLESLAVDLGAIVRKGEPIAQIDQRDYRLTIQQAEALLAQARVRL